MQKIIIFKKENKELYLSFSGEFIISNAKQIYKDFDCEKDCRGMQKIIIDLATLSVYDSYVVVFLDEIANYCKKENIEYVQTGIDEKLRNFIAVLKPKKAQIQEKTKTSFVDYISGIGNNLISMGSEIIRFIDFLGAVMRSMFKVLLKPNRIRWNDFFVIFSSVGVNALPITVLILLLLGFITGWQGAIQLKMFGGDMYLAPLVGFSIIRELSPIMVAIVIAGRSGSAFTAEIGTMKVSEELDALETMGFDKHIYLVIPRILALVIAMPLLVIICDFVGVIGGLIAGLTTLDITITSYFNELKVDMEFIDVGYGLVKSVIFGFTIALIGAFRGMSVTNSSESVGKNTTSSVVTSIFLVIIIDAFFVVLYDAIFY